MRTDLTIIPIETLSLGDRSYVAHDGEVAFLAGRVTFKSASGEVTFEAGDAYYVPPGHTPMLYADTEVVGFSPTEQVQQTLEVVTKNMQAAG